ncbi:MAG: CHAT domain-containing protein, partial [Kovacikia sp.]
DQWLRRLPWHQWELLQDYPKAELALSQPEYKRGQFLSHKVPKNKVRILAVLGNSQGIDLEAEVQFLKGLQDAEVIFLVSPSRQEFNAQLWSKLGWDILFFAGHSRTEAETGRLYINEDSTHNSITIEQLREALKAAVEQGLKVAIFNSCDGLGLAFSLEQLHVPLMVVMREPVSNRVAQEFFKHFLEAFALEQLPFCQSFRQARRKLQGLEDDFPGASWLPAMCQNPATEPPTWVQLGGNPLDSTGLIDDTLQEKSWPQASSPPPIQEETPVTEDDQAITDAFIQECERSLAEAMGPIARFLVQDTLASIPEMSKSELVETLSAWITDPQKRVEFRQRFLA